MACQRERCVNRWLKDIPLPAGHLILKYPGFASSWDLVKARDLECKPEGRDEVCGVGCGGWIVEVVERRPPAESIEWIAFVPGAVAHKLRRLAFHRSS